ncbi:uncharacterized protein LOC112494231 isoform X3 [Cephus cinctus]|uniref:Uncharacterized protein LOC112494231 isoform X3 n=1 Tax=Cephus cinctus TaxID=211228 RepID=A0AAJ7RFF7_CEPCN|nr:uncharacterized protein LOC112494231 isoform X3 [Cephus cinctus]
MALEIHIDVYAERDFVRPKLMLAAVQGDFSVPSLTSDALRNSNRNLLQKTDAVVPEEELKIIMKTKPLSSQRKTVHLL